MKQGSPMQSNAVQRQEAQTRQDTGKTQSVAPPTSVRTNYTVRPTCHALKFLHMVRLTCMRTALVALYRCIQSQCMHTLCICEALQPHLSTCVPPAPVPRRLPGLEIRLCPPRLDEFSLSLHASFFSITVVAISVAFAFLCFCHLFGRNIPSQSSSFSSQVLVCYSTLEYSPSVDHAQNHLHFINLETPKHTHFFFRRRACVLL